MLAVGVTFVNKRSPTFLWDMTIDRIVGPTVSMRRLLERDLVDGIFTFRTGEGDNQEIVAAFERFVPQVVECSLGANDAMISERVLALTTHVRYLASYFRPHA